MIGSRAVEDQSGARDRVPCFGWPSVAVAAQTAPRPSLDPVLRIRSKHRSSILAGHSRAVVSLHLRILKLDGQTVFKPDINPSEWPALAHARCPSLFRGEPRSRKLRAKAAQRRRAGHQPPSCNCPCMIGGDNGLVVMIDLKQVVQVMGLTA